jgi:dTDP-4-dehydrorhamnose 3,5-epimerase
VIFKGLPLQGAFLIDIELRQDDRGMFARVFCAREFEAQGLNPRIVQCNVSTNLRRGTLRGMHFQRAPFAEVKIVRCTRGALYDVIIDIRPASPTYLKWFSVELTEESHRMIYVPEGFAHGYQALTDGCEAFYMVTQFYSPEHEGAIRWDDPLFCIPWPVMPPFLSPKDASHGDFQP